MAEFLPLRQKAPMMVGIMWMFQVIAFILVGFRLYTRLVVMHIYGIDDHFFNFAVFCLLVYVILMTVAARYGLGQEMTNPASEETSRAQLLVNVGQTVTSVAAISIKISIACFLLRIVGVNTAQKVAIIIPVALMSLSVFIAIWLIWFSCKPFWAPLVSFVMILVVELWYASFPWYLIRGLEMPRREKILIGTSMSISYISAGCSIARLLNLLQLANAADDEFLLTIVDVLIWHAADVTTQLFCIGVTVCRPLYKNWLYRVADHIEGPSNTAGHLEQDPTYGARKAPELIALRTVGGSEVKPVSDGATSDRQRGRSMRRDLVFQSDDPGNEFITTPMARISEVEKGI
ncbi:hypothetical protein INS49_003053 [Diaporthe citri]|uniref:uncharacterized protein n=1 Tax=Diaporthe citri TaxID=83186 RepID=UPI001C807A29|nr:uncharacterized protein INS49_003053 [Diaporthe citri]KAG6368837.1 hypothetical protein INS49_003053 [Diaporthe citri]